MLNYESSIRPWLFRMDPERVHGLTVSLLRLAGALPPVGGLLGAWFRPGEAVQPVQAFGLTFSNVVGLAAGYDKDGLGWRGLARLGFGHIEIGTVTVRPQAGNPGRRVFRLPADRAVVNRMGFPSRGADFVVRRLQGPRPKNLVLGVNIGKNKTTPIEQAGEDYMSLLRTFAPLADYLAINVSSPNTPGLRMLQTRSALEALLRPLAAERANQERALGRRVPLLVKIAPDLAQDEFDAALEAIAGTGMDGVIVSNTSIQRPAGLRSPEAVVQESGGLSGAPLRNRTTQLVRRAARVVGCELPIVACGGVMEPDDVCSKMDAGATLVQLYTGLIYAGPGLVRNAVNATAGTPQQLPVRPVPWTSPAGLQPEALFMADHALALAGRMYLPGDALTLPGRESAAALVEAA